jgi:eukaryotic-like serine/threonine-protein kinase
LLFFHFSRAKIASALILGNEVPAFTEPQAMNEPHDHNRSLDVPSVPADSLDAGLAAAFGRPAEGPRSSLGQARPVLLKEAEGERTQVVMPKSDAMPQPEQAGDRYQLFGEIARGGMGAVLRGRDVDLGRELAVKVLLEKHAGRPEVVGRFLEEAQIGGQLQHPNVVPVYDVGHFGERPFFTMKLVKGQTLAALLGERADPAADRPRLLNVALQVTQALAYAHAHGVIHRDLKPANVMVGSFGEVQVMDWGLAKVLAEGGVADEERASRQHHPEEGTMIRTARSSGTAGSHGTDTEAGSLLGTPAYMPPEQANGYVAYLDRRADVFGLGGILCEILTGEPPYVGRSFEEVLRKGADGDLADATARLDACGADRELIDLTKACLAPKVIDRPKDAQAVADALTAYLDGVQERLQAAQRERAVAVVRASEESKRRKVQLALAAAVVGLLLGGGAFAWWRGEQAQLVRQREGRNAEAVAALLEQCKEALEAGDAAKAKVALDAARKRSAEGGAAELAERLGRLDADLALLRDLNAVDQFRWTWTENTFPDEAAVATQLREALRRFGADPDATSVDEAAARVYASAVRERIVTALDRLLQQEKTAGVRAVLRLVDADRYRDEVRDAVLADDRAKMVELAGQKAALEQPPGFAAFLGDSRVIDVGRRRELLQAAVSRRPGNLGLLMALGNTCFEKVDGLSRRPGDLGLLTPLGPHYLPQKESADEQLRWYQAAIAAAPANFAAHINLGSILCVVKRDYDGAIAYARRAIEIDPKHAYAPHNLGLALRNKGQPGEAIPYLRKSIALDPTLAATHDVLGLALQDRDQLDEAIECFLKATAFDPSFVGALEHLSLALLAKGELDEAIACSKKAIALIVRQGRTGRWHHMLAHFHHNLGVALHRNGQVDEAITSWEKATDLDPKDADILTSIGRALHHNGQVDEAIRYLRKAIALDPKSARARVCLGISLCDGKKDYDGAIACFEKALELDPKSARAHDCVGVALFGKGRVDAAAARCRRALELDPKFGHAYFNLTFGLAEAAAGQGEQAARHSPEDRVSWGRQALDSLREGLASHDRRLESGKPADRAAVRMGLRDLARIRDETALAKLPAEQQKAFTQLLADVAALLKKAETPTPKASADKPNPILSALEDALEVLKARLGPDHPRTLSGMNNLALGYRESGKLERALPLFEETLKRRKATLGPDHRDTLFTMTNLAVAHGRRKQFDKSTPLYEEILKRQEATLGRDHSDTLGTLANLGVNYRDASRLAEAIPLLEEAHRAAKKYPQLEVFGQALLAAYKKAGKNARRLELLEETLEFRKETLGPDHRDTLQSMNDLAGAYGEVGDVKRALPLLEEVLKGRKAKLGPYHRDTLKSMNNLGWAYTASAKLDRALALYEETLKLRKARLGSDHPETLMSMSNLGAAYWQGKQLAKSIPLLEEALKGQEAKLGRDDLDTLRTVANLGVNYKDAGRLEEAIPLLEEAHRAARKYPELGFVRWQLLDAYAKAGKMTRRLELLEETLEYQKETLGPDHRDTFQSMYNLALAYQQAGKPLQAVALHEQLRDAVVKKHGADHLHTLATLNNLGNAYHAANRLPEAIKLLEQVRDTAVKELGADNPSTLSTLACLAAAYRSAGKLREATTAFEQAAAGVEKRRFQHEHAGFIIPSTADAYEAAEQLDKAEAWRRKWLAVVKGRDGAGSIDYAGAQADLGQTLVLQKKWAEAETTLKECLAIREKKQPDAWTTFNTKSMLGGALLGQKKYAEAEKLLLEGYRGMKRREKAIPPQGRDRIAEALDRLIALYAATDRSDEAERYRAERRRYPEVLPPPLEEK